MNQIDEFGAGHFFGWHAIDDIQKLKQILVEFLAEGVDDRLPLGWNFVSIFALNKLGKFQAHAAHAHNGAQNVRMAEAAILQTNMQKILMNANDFVDIRNIFHAFGEGVPIRFDDLNHHVVLEVLDGIQHSLT